MASGFRWRGTEIFGMVGGNNFPPLSYLRIILTADCSRHLFTCEVQVSSGDKSIFFDPKNDREKKRGIISKYFRTLNLTA